MGKMPEAQNFLIPPRNSTKAYQLVNDLTSEKQGRSTTIQDNLSYRRTRDPQQMDRVMSIYSILRVMVSTQFWTAGGVVGWCDGPG